jgi:hypothetical protein
MLAVQEEGAVSLPEAAQEAVQQVEASVPAPGVPQETSPAVEPRPVTPEQVLNTPPAELASQADVDAQLGTMMSIGDTLSEMSLAETTVEDLQLPPVSTALPGRYLDLVSETTSPEVRAALRKKVGDNYIRGVLTTGDAQRDSRRLEMIGQSTGYAIPVLDEAGQPMLNPDGSIQYKGVYSFPREGTSIESRVIQMMELNPSDTGVYHFFTAGDPTPKQVDLGLRAMLQETPQSDFAKFFYRFETEKGGMSNFDKVLRDAGIVNPVDRIYYLRQQAQAGPFSGIEATRMGASIADIGAFIGNIGLATPEVIQDLSAAVPFYVLQAMTMPARAIAGVDVKGGFGVLDLMLNPDENYSVRLGRELTKLRGGEIEFGSFDDAATALSKSSGLSVEQAEAILMYSPDLTTTVKRFAAESLVTGGGILSGSRFLAAREMKSFNRFLFERAYGKPSVEDARVGKTQRELWQGTPGEPPYTGAPVFSGNLDDAIRALEAKGMDAKTVMQEYVQEYGGTALSKAYLRDALDLDIQARSRLPGPFRTKLLEDNVNQTSARLSELEKKLDAARKANRSPGYIANIEIEMRMLDKKLYQMREDTLVPLLYKQYLKGEAIATVGAATAYQAVYDTLGEDPMMSSIGAGLGAFLSTAPAVTRGFGNLWEDFIVALSSSDRDELKVKKGAILMRRHIENSPPEIRDQIFAFQEFYQNAKEEMGKFVFPANHARAGQQILSDDTFDKGFYYLSGLLSLRQARTALMGETIDIVGDAGKLSENMARIERNLQQEQKLMNEAAEIIDSFRFFKFDDLYDPKSDAGRVVELLTGYYDQRTAGLAAELDTLTTVTEQRSTIINALLSGTLTTGEVQDLIDGKAQLAELLAVDRAHYMRLRLEPDATVEEQAVVLQEYHQNLNQRVADAFERNARFRYNADENAKTANSNFVSFLETQEQIAYQNASSNFDALRQNPLYKDARIDMTDIFDQMLGVDADMAIIFDPKFLTNSLDIGSEGVRESRAFAGLNLPASTERAMARLFSASAREYLDNLDAQFKARGNGDELRTILEGMGVENDGPISQFRAVREYFEENAEQLGDSYEALKPRLGVDPAAFMQVVSGIGSTAAKREGTAGAIAPSQLRETLLERGKTGFFENFYDPELRSSVEGFAEDYEKARKVYRDNYIVPFRETSSTVIRELRSGEKIDMNTFERFMDEFNLGKEGLSIPETREGLVTVMERLTGGRPIDVTTNEGKQIRALLTQYVADELARTPGARKMEGLLLRSGSSPLIDPSKAAKIEQALYSGSTTVKTTRLRNLLARDEKGNYIFADVNGQPLVDPALVEAIGFETYMKFDPKARDAVIQLQRTIAQENKALLARMKDITTVEGNEIAGRKYLVQRLNAQGGIGKGLFDMALTETGLQDIAKLRSDFVELQVSKGVSRETAELAFEQVKQQSVIEHVFGLISEPGDLRAFSDPSEANGINKSLVMRTTNLAPQKLMELLGARGDSVTPSRESEIIRQLLGDEIYDNFKLVGNQLFVFDPKTQSLNIKGVSMPLSAESLLSRGTSFARGVISLRWLVSEAAIRESRKSAFELTKLMLFDPRVGREVMDMVTSGDYNLDKPGLQLTRILISAIAKNDALQQFSMEDGMDMSGIDQLLAPQEPTPQEAPESGRLAAPLENQMDSLLQSP